MARPHPNAHALPAILQRCRQTAAMDMAITLPRPDFSEPWGELLRTMDTTFEKFGQNFSEAWAQLLRTLLNAHHAGKIVNCSLRPNF